MKMNRRNVLVGLGGIVASGGALLGTGAFSTVEADRTANISVTNDNNAPLTLVGDGTYVTGGDTGTISFEFTGLNENALTVIENVLTATNNANDGANKDIYVQEGGEVATDGLVNFVVATESSNGGEGNSVVGSGNAVTVASGESLKLDIEIDTEAGNPDNIGDITIVAVDSA